MNQDQFKIFVSQLHDGHTQQIDFTANPKFLDIDEPELHFPQPVQINGEAYITSDELILHLTVTTQATIPCSICNEPITLDVNCKGFYYTLPVNEIKSSTFDFTNVVRENLLLEVPRYAECNNGECPARKTMSRYLKEGDDEGQKPFANL